MVERNVKVLKSNSRVPLRKYMSYYGQSLEVSMHSGMTQIDTRTYGILYALIRTMESTGQQ